MMRIFNISLLFASLSFGFTANADHHEKVLFTELVSPILNAKCGSCHGADKQKGKLRLDTIEAIMKGGSEGVSVVAGKVAESSLIGRLKLPTDDDEHMPPEDKPQLTKEEAAVLEFWVQSGANPTATIAALKPSAEVDAFIKVVIANPPKGAAGAAAVAKVDPAKQKLAEETIGNVEKTGASLMAIAQDTPDLRFSALNVAREYTDKNLEALKPVADQVKWMDLARTQISDAGMAQLAGMKNLTRLHLENTKITDAGLEHLKGLANLEYLNLYGTAVTDAGLDKLSGLKNLKKIFVWQSKVTDAGAKKLGTAIPGIEVNTGWKEPPAPKPIVVAAITPAAPAPKPATPAPKPTTPAPAPAAAAPSGSGIPALDKAIAELKTAAAETQKLSDAAAKASTATEAASVAAAAAATAGKAESEKAAMIAGEAKAALDMLEKLAKLSPGSYDKAVAELKAATEKANADSAAAKKKFDEATAASTAAAAKIAGAKAAAAKALAIAQQTKAALDALTKAIAG